MISWTAIKKSLQNWVRDEGRTVGGENDEAWSAIWEEQSEARPERPYASLKIISGPLRKGSDQTSPGAVGTFITSGPREFTLSINAYGPESLERISKLMSEIEKMSMVAYFKAAGVACIKSGDVRDLTRLTGTRSESRHQFDVRFRTVDNITEAPGIIESVEVTNNILEAAARTDIIGTP